MSSQFNVGNNNTEVARNQNNGLKQPASSTFDDTGNHPEQMRQDNVSNLTKNLMTSHSQVHAQSGMLQSTNETVLEPSMSNSVHNPISMSFNSNIANNPKLRMSGNSFGDGSGKNVQGSGFSVGQNVAGNQFMTYSYPNQTIYSQKDPNTPHFYNAGDANNFIPSGHNTPTAVSTSYSSNHSYNNSFHGLGSLPNQKPVHSQFTQFPTRSMTQHGSSNSSYKPSGVSSMGIPTTNVSMDSASSNQYFGSFINTKSQDSNSLTNQSYPIEKPLNYQQRFQYPSKQTRYNSPVQTTSEFMQKEVTYGHFFQEPDHYMTYQEFFNNLCAKDKVGDDSEHLSIVDYPVNDLIMMLASLLTKIVEANDKLHPNHFDNTLSLRQKAREHKRLKRLDRQRRREDQLAHDTNSVIDEESDEEDEMKNKYLANVLAFHGTNVPGISLHAYLSRILKYCPVTNEVFLSLLVYFDRIAKKANKLKTSKGTSEVMGEKQDNEQLFVMDSYNIHRLIISGITVSSKFFSDIFYKNLRYAKVGGLPLEELNYLEVQFLLLLDFKLMITVEDLQNYGDLLLRFWKREQIADEIVNSSNMQGNFGTSVQNNHEMS